MSDVDQKRAYILNQLQQDPREVDLKIYIFVSAVQSRKPESCIKPFPAQYLDGNKEPDLNRLLDDVNKIPPVVEIHRQLDQLPHDVVDLLHWMLCRMEKVQLKRVTSQEWTSQLRDKIVARPKHQQPQHIFQVIYDESSNAEKRFLVHKQSQSDKGDTKYAFHGSQISSFYSILNYGLAQHLCKRDLYGEGTYLSTDLDVSLNFSPQGLGWSQSQLNEYMACVAYCEYVPHPPYVRGGPKIPPAYIVMTNNEAIRVRYLLVYAKPKRLPAAADTSSFFWKHKAVFSAIFYILLMAMVGLFGGNFGDHIRANLQVF